MKIQFIRIFEHESLKIGEKGFTEKYLKLLSKYLGDKEGDDFPYYSLINNGVKFKQYVGVISVGDIQIEVLPKADKVAGDNDADTWESHLVEMLKAVFKMKVDLPTKAEQQIRRNRVLDVFLDHFMDEVENILHIGLVKTYRRVESNNTALKGRLVMTKHIVKNLVHKERFYVDYTTYDRNHLFNRLLYKALKVIPDIASGNYSVQRAKALMFEFPEVDDINVNDATFNHICFDRKTEDYREAMELTKMILLNYMPNMRYCRGNSVLALMFDMNKLWEQYVYVLLKRSLRDDGLKVTAQNRKDFWMSDDVGVKIVRPDIVVSDGNKCIAVLDTKWKCPKDSKASDSDLKQMYVYHHYWDTEHSALLYPGDNEAVEGHFAEEGYKCKMYFLPLKNNKESTPEIKSGILDLSKLIEYINQARKMIEEPLVDDNETIIVCV